MDVRTVQLTTAVFVIRRVARSAIAKVLPPVNLQSGGLQKISLRLGRYQDAQIKSIF
jgi:hypothetical protein